MGVEEVFTEGHMGQVGAPDGAGVPIVYGTDTFIDESLILAGRHLRIGGGSQFQLGRSVLYVQRRGVADMANNFMDIVGPLANVAALESVR